MQEISDEELDAVCGGIDWKVVSRKNLALLIKAIFVGDTNVTVELITQFLSEGEDPSSIEKLIDGFVKKPEVRNVLNNVVKTYARF